MSQPQDTPATSASAPPPHPTPVVQVEMPVLKVILVAVLICGVAAGIFYVGRTSAEIVNQRDMVKSDGENLKTNLQDVSAVFTYHLNTIAIMIGLASVMAIGIQVMFQMYESRKNQQLREQEEKRAAGMDRVVTHTGQLIQNMADLTKTTQESMKNVNDLQDTMRKNEVRHRDTLAELRRVSQDGLTGISITRASFPKDIQSAFSLARTNALGVPATDRPTEFLILDALYQGGHAGNSQRAVEMLEQLTLAQVGELDPPNRARYHYFRGHFAVRVGRFAEAARQFDVGGGLTAHPTGYRLFAVIARLFHVRQNPDDATFQPTDIVDELARMWRQRAELGGAALLGRMDQRVYWEQLGHTYAAILIEGVRARSEPDRPPDPTGRAVQKAQLLAGRSVAEEANTKYRELAGSDNGAIYAALYEAGLALFALGDETYLMKADGLLRAIEGCRIKLQTSDPREKIVYATRYARFQGRLAAEYRRTGEAELAKEAEAEMRASRGQVLGLIQAFRDEWMSGGVERLYSVFTNGYELAATLYKCIEDDVTVDNYARRLAEAEKKRDAVRAEEAKQVQGSS